MRDKEYQGSAQKINTLVRGEKWIETVLKEWRISTVGKNAEWMRNELASHPDFKNEINMERFLVQKELVCISAEISSRA